MCVFIFRIYRFSNFSIIYLDSLLYNEGVRLDPQKIYREALTDFLLTGGEANLDFLKEGNPDITKIDDPASRSPIKADIRLAIIKFLEK